MLQYDLKKKQIFALAEVQFHKSLIIKKKKIFLQT